MTSFSSDREVEHSASDMFNLVADVEAYPEFVPLCSRMEILERDTHKEVATIRARMTVSYSIISEAFSSLVVLDRAGLAISVVALDGPFRRLRNEWSFEDVGEERCGVHFVIDYEFRSRALGLAMGAVFDRAFRRFANAFENRADEIYGVIERRSPPPTA